MSVEADRREGLVLHGRSLHDRGLSPETSGNLSVRLDAGLAVLLVHHGPVVSAGTLEDAVAATEEPGETARLLSLLRGSPTRLLTGEQARELREAFPGGTAPWRSPCSS